MTLNQLKYIVEAAKAGSINRAAANLFVSQSVLSTSIKNFETEIGRTIFNRTPNGVSLTPFGITFVSYVSSIQSQLQQLDYLIYHSTPKIEFSLSIASTGYYFLDLICADIYKKYKAMGIRIEEYENSINGIADMVVDSVAEIGVTHLWTCYKPGYLKQLSSRGLLYYPIAQLDVAITIGEKNPLFYSKEDTIAASDLKDFPAIKYVYLDSGPYSDIYNRLHLPDAGSYFVVSSRSILYQTLHSSDAYYLNSAYPHNITQAEAYTPYSSFRTLRLKDCNIRSEIAWIKKDNRPLSPLADEVIKRIIQNFSSAI